MSSSGDILLQMLDYIPLFFDHEADDVADGDDADDTIAFHNGQVADVFVGHEGHALFYRVVLRYRDRVGGHEFADRYFAGMLPFQDVLSRIIPLRENTYECILIDNQ